MEHEIKGSSLIIALNLGSKELSGSGKTILLASSHGFQDAEVEINGKKEKIGVSYNVTRKVPK